MGSLLGKLGEYKSIIPDEVKRRKYIGCKIIDAEPMTDREFANLKGKQVTHSSDEDMDGYKVTYPDGYVSWSPKEVFEESYRQISSKEIELLTK